MSSRESTRVLLPELVVVVLGVGLQFRFDLLRHFIVAMLLQALDHGQLVVQEFQAARVRLVDNDEPRVVAIQDLRDPNALPVPQVGVLAQVPPVDADLVLHDVHGRCRALHRRKG